VGGLFLVFGIVKAIEPRQDFYDAISHYELLPINLIPSLGTILIVLEILFGLFLVLGLFTQWSVIGITGMLIMFILFIAQAMMRGLELPDCGCSGSLIQLGESPLAVLTRDALMLIGMAWILFRPTKIRWILDNVLNK